MEAEEFKSGTAALEKAIAQVVSANGATRQADLIAQVLARPGMERYSAPQAKSAIYALIDAGEIIQTKDRRIAIR